MIEPAESLNQNVSLSMKLKILLQFKMTCVCITLFVLLIICRCCRAEMFEVIHELLKGSELQVPKSRPAL